MDGVFEHAARWGIETEYRDAFGHLRSVEPAVLSSSSMTFAGGDTSERMLPRTVVMRGEADQGVLLAVTGGLPLRWEIRSERRIAQGEGLSPMLSLPRDLPKGILRLQVTVEAPGGPLTEAASLDRGTLSSAPGR